MVFLRWKQFAPDEPGRYLAELFSSGQIDFSNALTVIDEDTIRQRRYTPENRAADG